MKMNVDNLKKKLIVVVLTVLVFLSAVVLGVATVFRVHSVTVVPSVVSEVAKTEAQELKKRLEEVYDKDSIFFADDKDAEEIMAEFPYFRITSFKKDYPNRIVIEVTEDAEVYAVATDENDYYILGADGTVLEKRASHLNRLENKTNVIITGLESIDGEKGKKLSGGTAFDALLAFCNEMLLKLDGIQDNVISVQVYASNIMYRVVTREGVVLYVNEPTERTVEKANAVIDAYLKLSDQEKMRGQIKAAENVNGEIVTEYNPTDSFEGNN